MKIIYYINREFCIFLTLIILSSRIIFVPLQKINKKKVINMRFYQEWGGFIWEYNSIGEFLKVLLGRLIGMVLGFGVLYLIILWLAWYGSK